MDLPAVASVHQYVTKLAATIESNKDDLARLHSRMDQLQDTLKTILNEVTKAKGNENNDGRQDSLDISSDAD